MPDIFDRGNKKWVSLMIPELREGLEQFFAEEIHERPEIDEQRMEELNRVLSAAFHSGQQVVILYWDDGEREVSGRIVWFEMGRIRLLSEDGKVHINVNDVLGIESRDDF